MLCVTGPVGADDSLPPGHMIIQGDIIVPIATPSQRKGVVANAVYRTNTWPDGRVPYEFDDNLNSAQRDRISRAMRHWQDAVDGIDFVPKTAGDDAYVHIQRGGANNSSVGRVTGRQIVNVMSFGETYEIEHELGHVLGLWHEQSRPDRDRYIDIHWDKIKKGKEYNFEILPNSPTHGGYDFNSLMHYGPSDWADCSFWASECKTITVKDAYADFAGAIGQRRILSTGDIAAVKHLYQRREELSIDLSGEGAGVVTSDPLGILCSTTSSACDYDFEARDRVELRAAPRACATFGGWSGDCAGTGTCSVTMSGRRRATARFDRVPNCSSDLFGGSSVAASPITRRDNLYAEAINWDGDEDWFYFFGNQGDSITLKVYAPSGSSLIPQFAIKRIDGETNEATATYPLSNYAHILNHRLSRDGKFYVKIRGQGSSTGAYVFEKREVLDHDAGGDAQSAQGLPASAEWDEFINFPGDQDWYRFSVGQEARFNWRAFSRETSGETLFKLRMSLHDGTGRFIASAPDDEDASVRDAYIRRTLSPGDYLLRVRGFGDLVGSYSLELDDTAGACAPPQITPMNDILVNYGQPLTLVAGVEGSSPLFVEWWTEGTEAALLSSSQELYRPSMTEDASYRVIASNGCGMDSEVVHVRVLTPCDAPQAADLASPPNGAAGISVTPVLSWAPVPGATNYDLFVDGGLYTSTLQTSIVLGERPLGTSVTWSVRTYAYCGTFRDSPTWVFTTETTRCTPPPVVQLASPPPSATSVIATPTFYWNPVAGATSYELLIDGIAVSSGETTGRTGGTFAAGSTHTWQVRAVTDCGLSSLSEVWWFTTRPQVVPSLFAVSPNAGDVRGGTFVTIYGSDFAAGAIVRFDGVPALAVTVLDSFTITCLAPPHPPGLFAVSVQNPDGLMGAANNAFAYYCQSPPSAEITISMPGTPLCPNAAAVSAVVPPLAEPGSYFWSIANGTITSGQGTAAILFTAGGTGQVQLTARVSTASGCTREQTYSIAIAMPDMSGSTLYTAAGGTGTISVTSSCSWPVSSRVSWIAVTPAAGSGNGNVTLQVAANPSADARRGTVMIGSRRVVIVQQASTAALSCPAGVVSTSLRTATPGGGGWSVVGEDFNGDSRRDLAMLTDDARVSILLGDGAGRFTPLVSYASGSSASGMASADFDEDGHADLVIASPNSYTVTLLFGSGTGTFGRPRIFTDISGPWALAVADFDRDNHLDFCVTNLFRNELAIFRGNGRGEFRPPLILPTASLPWAVAVADYDQNGEPDIAIAHKNSADVYVYANHAASFSLQYVVPVSYGQPTLTAADINRDGRPDLVHGNDEEGSVNVLMNSGVGFAPYRPFPAQLGFSIKDLKVADMDNDGRLDLVIAAMQRVWVSRGLGAYLFDAPVAWPQPMPGTFPMSVTVGDFNSDGAPDIVANDWLQPAVDTFLTGCAPSATLGIPASLTASAPYTPHVNISWSAVTGAVGYEVFRRAAGAWTYAGRSGTTGYADASALSGAAYLYRVRAVAADGRVSDFSGADLVFNGAFTDDPVVARITSAKAVHWGEMRRAIDAVRAIGGLPAAAYTAPVMQRGVPIRVSDLAEMRLALAQARTNLGLAAVAWSDPSPIARSTPVRALHLQQLRAAIK